MVFALIVGAWLSMILGALINDQHWKRHKLGKGSAQRRLEDVEGTLRAIEERIARVEQHHADDVLDTYRAEAAQLPRERDDR